MTCKFKSNIVAAIFCIILKTYLFIQQDIAQNHSVSPCNRYVQVETNLENWHCEYFLGCVHNYGLIGNGFCNDEANNADCLYDGGDCCGSCVLTDFCAECACLDETAGNESTNALIGNGFCNDETNREECDYDGGDCCGSCVLKNHCTECTCFGELNNGIASHNALIGNGYCNDETNNEECMFDGLDCCGSDVFDTKYCTECKCKGNV